VAALAYDDWVEAMARRCPECDTPRMDVHRYAGGAEFTCLNSECGYAEDLERDPPHEEVVSY
jgi:hypothetical protein